MPLPSRTVARRAAAVAAWLAALGGALAGPALALDVNALQPSRDEAGVLWVTLQLDDPLEDRIAASLARGMPATVELHAELWRRRSGWFDRMERASDAAIRIRRDVWADTWKLERAGVPGLSFPSLDSLEVALTRPIALPVARLGRLPVDAACYVVASVVVKPLDAGDVAEVEGWLSGEVQDRGRSGFGMITQLPRSVFDTVRNFAGLGDSRARATTSDFTPAGLPLARH